MLIRLERYSICELMIKIFNSKMRKYDLMDFASLFCMERIIEMRCLVGPFDS